LIEFLLIIYKDKIPFIDILSFEISYIFAILCCYKSTNIPKSTTSVENGNYSFGHPHTIKLRGTFPWPITSDWKHSSMEIRNGV